MVADTRDSSHSMDSVESGTGLHIFWEAMGGSGSPAFLRMCHNNLTLSPASKMDSPFFLSCSFLKKFRTARA